MMNLQFVFWNQFQTDYQHRPEAESIGKVVKYPDPIGIHHKGGNQVPVGQGPQEPQSASAQQPFPSFSPTKHRLQTL